MIKRIQRKWIILLAAVCAALLGVCFFCRHLYGAAPFSTAYAFEAPSGVFPGISGRTFVIDAGRKNVLVVDEQQRLCAVINGGTDSDSSPYYSTLVTEGADGSIYVADARYSGKGSLIKQERIFRYDSNGQNPEIVYSIDYDASVYAPFQYGNIQSLRIINGELVFTVNTRGGIDVCRLNLEDNTSSTQSYDLEGWYLSDSCVNPSTLLPVFTSRTGEVCSIDENGQVNVLCDEGRTSWMLTATADAVYYTDIAANTVIRYDVHTGTEEAIIEADSVLYTVEVEEERICTTDYSGYYSLENGELSYVVELDYAQPFLHCMLWVALFLGILLFVVLALIVLVRFFAGRKKSHLFQRMAIVLSVSFCIGMLVSYIIIDRMVEGQNESIMEQLNIFDDILIQATDVDALSQIDSLSDYKNQDYNKVKEPLDELIRLSYQNDLNYYYVLYRADESMIYVVMDYEETSVTRHPVYTWGTEGYTDVFVTGQPLEVSGDVSSYGAWSFVLKPVYDESGTVTAVMEVGGNHDAQAQENRALILDVILTVISTTVVLLMFIIETVFYAEHREKRRNYDISLTPSKCFPLRTMAFIMFLADCMQDPFVSILASQLYQPVLGIPSSVGAALPLSVQVLFAACAAFVCGSVVRRTGVKKMLVSGFVLQISGFIACGLVMSYTGLLVGKALIGIGVGALIVSMNSVAASGNDEEITAEAFTSINAGTLAGITVGAGIGSIILSFSDFSTVYYAGAIILVLGLLIAVSGEDYRERAVVKEDKKIRGLRFISDRSVWTFLLLLLMPFLIAISYREYFFPLYASEMGITETDIGRLYLLCGVIVIYLGPVLTRTLIERLGGKWTTVTASLLMVAATLVFAFVPTLPAALLGLLFISVSISFGYAAQSTYYSSLTRVKEFGESRAMGVYSLFDNGGQTLGPIVYGVALVGGYQWGIMIIGVGLAALLLLYLVTNSIKSRSKSDAIVAEEGKDKNAAL